MERIKVPFGWHVWGWFTLLASLGVHGFLLSLPMSFSLDAPEPEPEPIAAVPLTTLPKIASPPPELETTAVEPASESVYAEEKTYEPTSEYSSAVEEVYEPEPEYPEYIAADTLTYEPERQVTTTPFATTVSQTRRSEEPIAEREEEVTSSHINISNIRHKKPRPINPKRPEKPPVAETTSASIAELEQNLENAFETIYSSISDRLSNTAEDEGKQGGLEKDPQMISGWLLRQPQLTSQFFDGEQPKEGVIQVTLVRNPKKQDDEIEIQKLYENFVEPFLLEEGFEVISLTDETERKLYQANKESLVRHIMLVSLPKGGINDDEPDESKNFGTFIVVYDPQILIFDPGI